MGPLAFGRRLGVLLGKLPNKGSHYCAGRGRASPLLNAPVDFVNGSVLGIGLGLAFVAVASLLPHALIKGHSRQDAPRS